MRKEDLLILKKKELKKFPWWMRETMTDEEISSFSLAQLASLSEILNRACELKKGHESFFALSVDQVIHKKTGTIIEIEEDGTIEKVTPEYILNGAARQYYLDYVKQKKQS